MKRPLLLVLCIAAFCLQAKGEVITRTINVDLMQSIIRSIPDNAGNEGKQFQLPGLEAPVEPFFVQAGDIIITHIVFSPPYALKLTDTDNPYWSSYSGNFINREPVNWAYWHTSPVLSVASISGTITWDLLAGEANSLSHTYTARDYINVMSEITGANITDSMAVIGGFTITTTINSYTLESGDGELNRIQGLLKAGNIEVVERPVSPAVACLGFDSPLNNGAVKVKKNRVLPHKGRLIDENGQPIDDLGLTVPPVVQVIFDSAVDPAAQDVTSDALSNGAGAEGNQFEFIDSQWQFNLSTKNYSAAGTYTVTMQSGDSSEYTIDPTCTSQFVIH